MNLHDTSALRTTSDPLETVTIVTDLSRGVPPDGGGGTVLLERGGCRSRASGPFPDVSLTRPIRRFLNAGKMACFTCGNPVRGRTSQLADYKKTSGRIPPLHVTER